MASHSQSCYLEVGKDVKVKALDEIKSCLQPIADELAVEIWEVEFKQGHSPALTVYIDTETGVDLDTCEKFHRAIDPILDEFDPTYGAPYTLNVSSPGLDRPLKTQRDFDRHLGEKMEVKLFAPMQGKKYLEAKLVSFDGKNVELENEKGEAFKLELSKIAKINVAIDFGNEE